MPDKSLKDQYEFIRNAGGVPGAQAGKGGSKSMTSRLIIVAVVGIVLVIIAIVATSLLSNDAPSNKDQLLAVAKQQNEIIRVSGIGVEKARGIQAKNLAMTTRLSLTTDQKPLIDALNKQDVKVNAKSLGGGNSKTDQMLTTAEQNNRFDEAFLEYLQAELIKYQKNLNDAYKATQGKALKETLKTQYQNASILIGVKPEE